MSKVKADKGQPKKMGRPKKEKKGEMLWIPAEHVQAVKAYLEIAKRQVEQKTME